MIKKDRFLDEDEIKIILRLYRIEHHNVAFKLGLINNNRYDRITYPLLIKSLALIDKLSKYSGNQHTNNLIITICGILWYYKNPKWDLLHENLILFLSRIGYAPSAIMLDKDYDFITKKHGSLSSYINELYISIYNNGYEVNVKEKKFLLTEFQKKVWDKIDENHIVGISAPTSAGKSFLILLKTIELILERGGEVLYIVPTLTLISQVSSDFKQMLKMFNIENYEILNTYSPKEGETNCIYVLTQERAISAFSRDEKPFQNIQVFIIDEIQNIERVGSFKDLRAKVLYDLLIEYRHNSIANKIIISGPRIDKIGDLGEQIFGVESEEINANSSPVVNLTYSISKVGNKFFFKQYSDFTKEPFSIEITKKQIVGYGGSLYNDPFNDFIKEMILSLGVDSKNIIFAPNARQARKIALKLPVKEQTIINNEDLLNSLMDYLRKTVSDNYSLIPAINNGVAYHHGKLPHHVRFVIEKAIKDKLINNVVCTTTLMQGVNLPTQNVIIRNPKLYIRKQSNSENPVLTKYEIANLSGRAGRLLKDFIGRTFILDEDSFKVNEDSQQSLFEKATKKLDASYGNRFNTNRTEIINSLINNSFDEANENKFISCYIRQTILKYGKEESIKKLSSTGIELSNEEVVKIVKNLELLSVPKEICLKNRYWDPFDLEKIYHDRNTLSVPSSIKEEDVAKRIKELLLYFHDNFIFYYNRYVNVRVIPESDYIYSLSITAIDWAKEKPLKSLIYDHSDADKVEDLIERIQNKISYGIPILLKPLYDMVYEEHSILTFIEMGAFRPITRRLIEFNIPRETAVYLAENYFEDSDQYSDFEIIKKLTSIYDELEYWTKIQLESAI